MKLPEENISKRLARMALMVGVLAFAFASFAACKTKPPKPLVRPLDYDGQDPQFAYEIGIVGDSLTFQIYPQFLATVGDEFAVNGQFEKGSDIAQLQPSLDKQLSNPIAVPDISIINLGTNEFSHNDTPQTLANFDIMITALNRSDSDCIILTNMGAGLQYYPERDENGVPEVDENGVNLRTYEVAALNQAISDQVASNPERYKLVDLNAATYANPGILTDELVHLSAFGQQWISDENERVIKEECGISGPEFVEDTPETTLTTTLPSTTAAPETTTTESTATTIPETTTTESTTTTVVETTTTATTEPEPTTAPEP